MLLKIILALLSLITAYSVIAFSPNSIERMNKVENLIEEGLVSNFSSDRILNELNVRKFSCDELNIGIIAAYNDLERMSTNQVDTFKKLENKVGKLCNSYIIL